MLQTMRQSTQSTAAKVIIGLIVLSFAAFGLETLLPGGAGTSVAEVNGEEITPFALQEAITQQKRQLVSILGDDIDPALPAMPFKGACSLSGLYDLEPIRVTFLNEVMKLDPDTAKRNSPLYLDPLADIPLILSVGDMETDEFKRHQTELFAAWSAKGLSVDEVRAPDCHHYTIVGHFGDPASDLHKAMIAMMRDE